MAQPPLIRPTLLGSAPAPSVRGAYFVYTWGCQMNEEDSEQIGLGLQSIGFAPAETPQAAQVVLLNTCSVRRKPEEKAFSLLGDLRILKKDHPDMVIGVCGCMAQVRADEIRRRFSMVDFVVGTAHVAQIPLLVEETLQERRFRKRTELPERGQGAMPLPERWVDRAPKLKAFVPIQYGCDKYCAYCIVPSSRGHERSRPVEQIVEEVALLAERGTKEVTLLGQTVNSYGRGGAGERTTFADLLWKVAEIPGIERIRFTSPYPRDFRDDLIRAIRDCPKVMEHCHLPLQAGHDALLKRMKRAYTVEGFLKIVAKLREAVPGIGLTTDIIVGFPGEADEEFEGTLDVVRQVRFDGAFMFRYSPRPGTPAAEMEQVPAAVARERLTRLIDVQNGISAEVNKALVGRRFEVLVEGPSPKNPARLQGFSRESKMLHFPGDASLTGQIVTVEATHGHLWGLSGKLV